MQEEPLANKTCGTRRVYSEEAADAERTNAATLDNEIRSKIDQAVDRLPPKQKEVFVLRQLLNLSFKEIAAVVETSENTVKSRMRYALEGLRLELHDFYQSSTKGGSVS